jgi:hypothetical protein
MISQLSKACSHIADLLPRTELTLILYPTDVMKEAVAFLYVRILRFIQHAVHWYKQGKCAHILTAVAKPWALSFKDYAEDIGEQARCVDRLSNSACKAEIRDVHLEICETREELRKAQVHIYQLLQIAQSRSAQPVPLTQGLTFTLSYSVYPDPGAVGYAHFKGYDLQHPTRPDPFAPAHGKSPYLG